MVVDHHAQCTDVVAYFTCTHFFTVLFHLPPTSLVPTAIFMLASLTDWLDGFIARQYNVSSSFGAFLDPIADKVLVVSALLVLLYMQHSIALLLCAVIIITREIVVTALRAWMASIGQQQTVKVRWTGRVKASFQMLGITVCLAGLAIQAPLLPKLGLLLLVLSVLLTVYSLIQYLNASWDHLAFFKIK